MIKSYLSNREQVERVNDTTIESMPIDIDVPQNSVLGPLIFLMYLTDMFDNCSNTYVFADDTVVMSVEGTC